MRLHPSALVVGLVAISLLAAPAAGHAADTLPPIEHVWIVVLENKDYEDSFGPDTEAPYIARELTAKGQLLTHYYGTSHASLGNYLTMISGQSVNAATQGDCLVFTDILPGTVTPDGQTLGFGCVYPAAIDTVAGQLERKGLRWRGYMEDMGNTQGAPRTCRHPAMGEVDDTQAARTNDQYATRHNPFVYFRSIIDSPGCAHNVVPLEQLLEDVRRPETTPNYAFITPDLCNDGHDATCADGGLGGLPAADQFLRRWAPAILGSPGFAEHGMLIVTWDEANITPASSEACCGQPTGPNTLAPGLLGRGGGRTGSVVISPYTKPGTVNETPYNHYGLLKSVEDLFGLAHLGYAALPGLKAFGSDVFNQPRPIKPRVGPRRCRPARGGALTAALRLRGRLLTFRARRAGRVRISWIMESGRRVDGPRRKLQSCRRYQFTAPKGATRAELRNGRRTQRVARGPAAEHG